MVPEDAAGPLTDQEKRIVQRLFSSWQEVPLDFKRALSNSLMTDEDLALNTTQIFDLDRKLRAASIPIATYGGTLNISATPTDIAWPGGANQETLVYVSAGGGTLRVIANPTYGAGSRLTILNQSTPITVIDHSVGGSVYTRGQANFVLRQWETLEVMWDGFNWVEVARDQASVAPITGQITTAGGITAGTGFTCVRNSAGNYTITFTTAFANPPVFLAVVINNQPVAVDLIAVLAGSANVAFSVASTGVFQDQAFQFLAVPML